MQILGDKDLLIRFATDYTDSKDEEIVWTMIYLIRGFSGQLFHFKLINNV